MVNPEALTAIVFFGCGTVITLAAITITNIRKAYEAKHRSGSNSEEINALRHEVAHLHNKMNDVLLQLEFNKSNQPAELTERITPPEFNKLG
jgi:hypothetical protein